MNKIESGARVENVEREKGAGGAGLEAKSKRQGGGLGRETERGGGSQDVRQRERESVKSQDL